MPSNRDAMSTATASTPGSGSTLTSIRWEQSSGKLRTETLDQNSAAKILLAHRRISHPDPFSLQQKHRRVQRLNLRKLLGGRHPSPRRELHLGRFGSCVS